MAPDRRVAGVVDRPRAQLHLRPPEQILDQEQLPVSQHRIERRHAGVGAEHEDDEWHASQRMRRDRGMSM